MTRRILEFRAWDTVQHRMYDSFHPSDGYLIDETIRETEFMERLLEDTDLIWLQFTGFRDSELKAIYEHDVVETPYGLLEVYFDEQMGAWMLRADEADKEPRMLSVIASSRTMPLVVKGSIFDKETER